MADQVVTSQEYERQLWKKVALGSIAMNVLLLIGGGLFGPALAKKFSRVEIKEVIKEVVKEKLVTRTVRVPVEVAGKVAYREETTTEAVTDSATDTDTNLTDTQTESKQRNIVTLGMGCDRSISPSILVGATLLGPLGVAGQVTFQTSPPAFKTGNLWATIGL